MLKLILSIYVAWTSIETNKINLTIVLFILLYLIVIFTKEIVTKNKTLFKILSLLEAIIVSIFATNYMNLSVLMLSILIVEFFQKEIKNIYLGIVLSNIPVFILLKDKDIKNAVIILIIMLAFILIYEAQAD